MNDMIIDDKNMFTVEICSLRGEYYYIDKKVLIYDIVFCIYNKS